MLTLTSSFRFALYPHCVHGLLEEVPLTPPPPHHCIIRTSCCSTRTHADSYGIVTIIGRTKKLVLLKDWNALGDTFSDGYSSSEANQGPGRNSNSNSGGGDGDSLVPRALREVGWAYGICVCAVSVRV